MGKVNSETLVPLGWVMSGFAVTFSIACAGSFWVYSVNTRLQRIEEHMGIQPMADRKIYHEEDIDEEDAKYAQANGR